MSDEQTPRTMLRNMTRTQSATPADANASGGGRPSKRAKRGDDKTPTAATDKAGQAASNVS